jgi:hypothetical protein
MDKLARSPLRFAGSESDAALCCACWEATKLEVHTFLFEVYAHIELKRKAVFGWQRG